MNQDSDSWEPEFLESQLHGIDPENNLEEESEQQIRVPRGPKRIPIMWSRVICVSEDNDEDIEIYPIEADFAAMTALPKPPRARRAEEWAPLFLPTHYSKEHPDICLENYRLGERRLKTLGEEISKHRKRLREIALVHDKTLALEQDKDLHEVSCLARRIRRGDYNDGALRK